MGFRDACFAQPDGFLSVLSALCGEIFSEELGLVESVSQDQDASSPSGRGLGFSAGVITVA